MSSCAPPPSYAPPPSKKFCADNVVYSHLKSVSFAQDLAKYDRHVHKKKSKKMKLKNKYANGITLQNGKTDGNGNNDNNVNVEKNYKCFTNGNSNHQNTIINVNKKGVHKTIYSPISNNQNYNNNKMTANMNGNNERNANTSFSYVNYKRGSFIRERQSLPIYAGRAQLMKYLHDSDTNILVGETGSGKTTQVPQYLYEDRLLTKGTCVVTQPRRVAATSVAARVAQEMGTELGQLVGYSVRFDDVTSEKTKIKYATDGMLLREAMLDATLKKYSWVIFDEAHERTVNTDILFGVAKKAQKIRKQKGKEPLHILIMSATINALKFSEFFENCPMLSAPGRAHKLDIYFMGANEDLDDYDNQCIRIVLDIHKKYPTDEGILVFLTGQEEIEVACLTLRKCLQKLDRTKYPPLKVVPLYASLPQHLQTEALERTATGIRHVIICTNIAETSITIPGIRHVVDSGKAKVRTYNPTSGFDELKVRQISKAQAWQRAGRAGREAPGKCFNAYKEEYYEKHMDVMPMPEIHRTSLTTVVLQLLSVGVTDVNKFDFVDKPRDAYLKQAVEQLLLLEAIEKLPNGEVKLTEMGRKMSSFPLEPKYAKIILMGPKFNCTEEVLTIIAMLSGEQVFTTPSGPARVKARKCHHRFLSVEGDHLTLLNVYKKFNAAKKNKEWCSQNFLNYRNLLYAASIRKQLRDTCVKMDVNIVSAGEDAHSVLKCLLSGLFTQISEIQPGLKYLTVASHEPCKIHPTSVMFETRPSYLLYTELINTGTSFMHNLSPMQADWLYESAPDYFRDHHIKTQAKMYAAR